MHVPMQCLPSRVLGGWTQPSSPPTHGWVWPWAEQAGRRLEGGRSGCHPPAYAGLAWAVAVSVAAAAPARRPLSRAPARGAGDPSVFRRGRGVGTRTAVLRLVPERLPLVAGRLLPGPSTNPFACVPPSCWEPPVYHLIELKNSEVQTRGSAVWTP